jgi:cytosine/adenosine deaminase-related metal-dependent hydrolase
MTYRKFKADYLFIGDAMAAADSVLITTAEGRVQAVLDQREAGEGVETFQGLLCPGFVNCHCHLELSHLKGAIPQGTGLVDFLLGVMGRRGRVDPDVVAAAVAAGEQEMWDNGIVAVGDICNTSDTVQQKQAGRISYHNFIEVVGFIEKTAGERFTAGMRVAEAFGKGTGGSNSIVPHAPYSVSPALLRRIADLPGNQLQTIHNQESSAENEFLLLGKGDFLRLYKALGVDVSWFSGTGKRSLESVLPYVGRRQPLILVHNVATAAEDLDAGEAWTNLSFCLCPNANLYIGGKLPDVGLLSDRGCRIVVGTDSLASNHRLDILDELKTLQRSFPWLETSILLQWATANGAGALQMEDTVGRFTPGLRPGVLLLEGLEGDRLTKAAAVRRLI